MLIGGILFGTAHQASTCIAVAANRECIAGVDDAAARAAADEWGVPTVTTQDLLRAAIAEGVASAAEAEAVNALMLAEGFFGTPHLW